MNHFVSILLSVSLCRVDKGFVRDANGNCVCSPGSALDIYENCVPCRIELGYKIDETGHCVCALERGMVRDERGRCVCPEEHDYRLTPRGECVPCKCGENAYCNITNDVAVCTCLPGYYGNPEVLCYSTSRKEFPPPELAVSCLADGVQVKIHIAEDAFNGVLYVKGHSKNEDCRRIVNLTPDTAPYTDIFKVQFGNCGLIHVNGMASFVLVVQKHPKLVTYKTQAYQIRCVYQTGEQNVTLGFNVSMLTTAGTIANTGPPPICSMRIVTNNGDEINSAEIGDNLMLQVDVQPASKCQRLPFILGSRKNLKKNSFLNFQPFTVVLLAIVWRRQWKTVSKTSTL